MKIVFFRLICTKGVYPNGIIVENVIDLVMKYNPEAIMVIKSTIPVGYTKSIREKTGSKNILFSPEFLRESKALYDNGYPQNLVG